MTRSFEEQIQATRTGSGAWYARAQQAVGGGLGHDVRHALPFPTYIARAQGAYKWDVDGHRYIDYHVGNGALLPLCFALPLDLGTSPARVGELTAWMLGIGHGMAALGPLIVGPLHELTDGFEAGLLVLFGLILFDVFLCTRVPRRAPAPA